jgi:hypothetical protein
MGFFKKLSGGASNFFKKAGNQTDNFFKKASGDVTRAADVTGRGIVQGANVVGGGLKQVGNVLEKAAPIATEVAGGIAMLAGQPELAVPLMAAGATAQRLGSQAKMAGRQIQSSGQAASVMIGQKTNALTNTLAAANTQLQAANAQVVDRLNAASSFNPSMSTPANGLAQIHSDLAQ